MIQFSHPYKDLEGTELWKKVSQGIDDLVKIKRNSKKKSNFWVSFLFLWIKF